MNRHISVVIPTKNRSHFLKRLLGPFKNYVKNVQIIVVDDGSNPLAASQNKQTCAHISGSDYNYISISKGAAAARNLGLKKCIYEYVWFIDDDDQVPDATIRDVIHEISVTSAGVFLLPMIVMYNDLVLNSVVPVPEIQNYQYYRRYGQPVNTSCAIFKREEVVRVGGWDEKLVRGDDTSLFLCLSQRCGFYCIETKPVIVNVGHSERMTRGVIKEQIGKLQFLYKHWKHLGNRRRIYYIFSFIIIFPAFLHLRLRWNIYKAKRAHK